MINIQNYTIYWHQYRWSTSFAYSIILDVMRVLNYYLKYFYLLNSKIHKPSFRITNPFPVGIKFNKENTAFVHFFFILNM